MRSAGKAPRVIVLMTRMRDPGIGGSLSGLFRTRRSRSSNAATVSGEGSSADRDSWKASNVFTRLRTTFLSRSLLRRTNHERISLRGEEVVTASGTQAGKPALHRSGTRQEMFLHLP